MQLPLKVRRFAAPDPWGLLPRICPVPLEPELFLVDPASFYGVFRVPDQ